MVALIVLLLTCFDISDSKDNNFTSNPPLDYGEAQMDESVSFVPLISSVLAQVVQQAVTIDRLDLSFKVSFGDAVERNLITIFSLIIRV